MVVVICWYLMQRIIIRKERNQTIMWTVIGVLVVLGLIFSYYKYILAVIGLGALFYVVKRILKKQKQTKLAAVDEPCLLTNNHSDIEHEAVPTSTPASLPAEKIQRGVTMNNFFSKINEKAKTAADKLKPVPDPSSSEISDQSALAPKKSRSIKWEYAVIAIMAILMILPMSRCATLEAEVTELNSSYSAALDDISDSLDGIESGLAKQEHPPESVAIKTALEEVIHDLESENTELVDKLAETEAKNLELTASLAEATTKISELEVNLEASKSEAETAKAVAESASKAEAQSTAPASSSGWAGEQSSSSEGSGTVYYTSSGKKYHSSSSCSGMKSPISATVSQAQASGRDACSKCY